MNPPATPSPDARPSQAGAGPNAGTAAAAARPVLRAPRQRLRSGARLLAAAITATPAPRHLARHAAAAIRLALARVRHGRPGTLALRTAGALIPAGAALHSGAGPAPVVGTVTGIAICLALTARGDLAPPPGR